MYQLLNSVPAVSQYVFKGYQAVESMFIKAGNRIIVFAGDTVAPAGDSGTGSGLSGIETKLKTASDDLFGFLKNIGSAVLVALIAWQILIALLNSEDDRAVSKVKKTLIVMLVLFVLLQNANYIVDFIKNMAGTA